MTPSTGQLNNTQKRLIRRHYGYWRELDTGTRLPVNSTEEHFVAVCRGIAQPVTEHEATYAAFKAFLFRRKLSFDQVTPDGFEPIPDCFGQPSEVKATDVTIGPVSVEQIVEGWQARATEADELDGQETSKPSPGFIYRDDRSGNRRWNN
jgi:hypothetical protein